MEQRKNSNTLFILLIIGLLLIVGFILLKPQRTETYIEQDIQNELDYHFIEDKNGNRYDFDSSIISILFMGIDTTNPKDIGQADSLQLYMFNRNTKKIKVLNISRDTMTDIHIYDVSHNDLGWKKQHLALAYAYGDTHNNGAMLTCQAVSKLLNNIPINYYVAMDLTKLPTVHNVVKELEVVVPNDSLVRINEDWTQGSVITLTPDNVEDFVRSRDISTDFSNESRMERQKEYLMKYVQKLKELLNENVDETNSKLYNVSEQLVTNIGLNDIQNFAEMLLTYSFNEQEDFYNIQGENQLGLNHDEFEVDQDALHDLIIEMFYIKED